MTAQSDISSDLDRMRADREATDWLILLQEYPDDTGIHARFDAWLAGSDLNVAAWAETRHAAAVLDATLPAHVDFRSDRPIAQFDAKLVPIAAPGRFSHARRRFAIGAMAAAAACLAIFATPALLLRAQADHLTGVSELRTVKLDDGSTVNLNASSAIAVNYAQGQRHIRLLQGTAYFEVTPDPDRPFTVAAGDVETTVLGTGFEVRLGDESADVAVRHGRVRVDDPQGAPSVTELLAAGEQIRVHQRG